jgi:hypothetical protein
MQDIASATVSVLARNLSKFSKGYEQGFFDIGRGLCVVTGAAAIATAVYGVSHVASFVGERTATAGNYFRRTWRETSDDLQEKRDYAEFKKQRAANNGAANNSAAPSQAAA